VRGERIAFALAAAAVSAHVVDHLIVGVESSLQFDTVVACAVVTILAAVAYPRLPRETQVVGPIALGVGWLIGDLFVHVLPMIRDGAQATDYTGVGATLGGALLIAVGVAAARRPAPGEGPLAPAPGREA
jgi:hypothetical protein